MRDICEREDLIITNYPEKRDYATTLNILLVANNASWLIPHWLLAGIVNGMPQKQENIEYMQSRGMRFEYAITNADRDRERNLEAKPSKPRTANSIINHIHTINPKNQTKGGK